MTPTGTESLHLKISGNCTAQHIRNSNCVLFRIDSRLIVKIKITVASVRRSKPLNQIITRIHTLVLLLRLRCIRAGNGLNLAIEIRVAKVSILSSHQSSCYIRVRVKFRKDLRNRVSWRMLIRLPRRLNNTVNSALDRIVTPSRQQISGIHDTRILNRCGVHILPTGALHLQPARAVLEEQRDTPVIRVSARPNLTRVDLEHLALDGWVVQQSQRIVAIIHKAIKEALIDTHTHSNGPHDLDVDLLALIVEIHHGGLEPGYFGEAGFIGPLVGVRRVGLATDFKGLFDVGVALLELGDLVDVGQLGDLFTPWGRVASICLGRGPSQGHFLVEA